MASKVLRASEWPKGRVTYAFDGFLPRRTLAMVAGKRNDGKSTFAAWVAARVSTGQGILPDGTLVEGKRPGVVWYNTMEDDPADVVRGRLQAARADMDQVWLTDWHLEIPDDAGRLRDFVRRQHIDLLVLDSMQQHFRNLYHGFRDNRRGMDLMFRLAKEADISILFVHHFNKGKHPSVEGAIGGQGIIQNMTKAIYVMGQHRSTLGSTTRYLACERIGVAAKPPSLAFELRTKSIPGASEPISYLDYIGVADVSSMDIFDASKIEERRSGRLTNVEAAREWLLEHFQGTGGHPVKVRDVEAAAQQEGRWFSKGTFLRAREMAGVEPVGTVQLREALGEEFDWLPSDDRPPKARWVRLSTPQLPGPSELSTPQLPEGP